MQPSMYNFKKDETKQFYSLILNLTFHQNASYIPKNSSNIGL
jgi:hypothetical protein